MKIIKLIAISLIPFIFACATAHFELTGIKHSPIGQHSVREYEEIPSNAEIIGNLSVSSEYDGGISGIIRKAAKVGANGYKILETNQVPLQGVRPGACASCKWETYTYVSYIYRAVLFYIPEKIEN